MPSHAPTHAAQMWASSGRPPVAARALPSTIGPASVVGRPQKSQRVWGGPPATLPSVLVVKIVSPPSRVRGWFSASKLRPDPTNIEGTAIIHNADRMTGPVGGGRRGAAAPIRRPRNRNCIPPGDEGAGASRAEEAVVDDVRVSIRSEMPERLYDGERKEEAVR